MATVLIDKLLEACVKQGASDIHITTGQPPVFRLHGRLRRADEKHHAGALSARASRNGEC